MKASVATLVLLGTALTAGLALAQTPPQPCGGQARSEPGAGAGETRAQVNSSGGTLAVETIAPRTGPVPIPACGPVAPTPTSPSTRSTTTPVNGIGGQGGGRLSNRGRPDNGETRATANPSGGPIDIESWSWGRIDRLNTVEACTARRGVVLMHEGVRQCRLPATPRREEANSAMGAVSTTR